MIRPLLLATLLASPASAQTGAVLVCDTENGGPGVDLHEDGTVDTTLGQGRVLGQSVAGDLLEIEIEDADGSVITLTIDQRDMSMHYVVSTGYAAPGTCR